MESGFFRSWYSELRRFDFRSSGSFLPHLSLGVGYVTLFLSSSLASGLSDDLAILIAYGPHAYHWKHELLSNGLHLSFMGRLAQFPVTLVFWGALMLAADFCSMLIHQIVDKYGHWAKTGLYFLGGAVLLLFAVAFYGSAPLGPIYAFIGGPVLILESFFLLFRRPAKSEA